MPARLFAFIRAINTGGRRLTNEQVLAPFLAAGFEDVAAYQAAGNVTFHAEADPDRLEVDLAATLVAAYGFEAPIFVRAAEQLRTALDSAPFTREMLARTDGRTQITFMASAPTEGQVAEVSALVPDEDEVAFVGREWFWLPRGGISASSLPVPAIERIVGPMTMRSLGTVERLLARYPD